MIKSTLNSTEIDSSSTLTRLSKIKEGQYLILNTDKPRPARILDFGFKVFLVRWRQYVIKEKTVLPSMIIEFGFHAPH